MAKVLWKVPLRVEDKRSLLQILTDLLKDHVGGKGERFVRSRVSGRLLACAYHHERKKTQVG